MKITITNPETIFGAVVKTFDDYAAAMDWVKVCMANGVKVVIERG